MAEDLVAEVVVVGAGPAGLSAAIHAAEGGARTLLLDRGARAGGQIWRHRGDPPRAARELLARLHQSGAVGRFETPVVDAPEPGVLLVEEAGTGRRVRYDHLVLATGARERFLPFPGWTLPGIIGVGGAQALLKQGARFEGLKVVVAGTGPLLLTVAAALASDGARVVGIAEQAPLPRLARFGWTLRSHPRKLAQGIGYRAQLLGVPYRTGTWVHAAAGDGAIEEAVLTDGRRGWTWDCDVLACAWGLVPNLELPRLLGCGVEREAVVLDDTQRTSAPAIFAAGELGGIGGDGHALVTGAVAGLGAAGRSVPPGLARARVREAAFAAAYARAFAPRDELRGLARGDTIVCRCEDVVLSRLTACRSAREAKLRTRAGMGACQGRVCGPALDFLRGWGADSVRPPLEPVPLSVLEDSR